MYLKEHVDLLNDMGVLTTPLLVKKFKISFENARSILEAIVDDYENVVRHSENKIFIEGRENELMESQMKKSTNKKYKNKLVVYESGLKKVKAYWD
jgi:uncharacterized protein (DUF1919 family)